MRPRPPGAQIQQEASPAKGGKGDKGKQPVPEPEPEEITEDGGTYKNFCRLTSYWKVWISRGNLYAIWL